MRTADPSVVLISEPMVVDPACAKILDALREQTGEALFNSRFRNRVCITRDEDGFRVGVQNPFLKEWMNKSYGGEIQQAVEKATGSKSRVLFAVDAGLRTKLAGGSTS